MKRIDCDFGCGAAPTNMADVAVVSAGCVTAGVSLTSSLRTSAASLRRRLSRWAPCAACRVGLSSLLMPAVGLQVITEQYMPLNNTHVYNGVLGTATTLTL